MSSLDDFADEVVIMLVFRAIDLKAWRAQRLRALRLLFLRLLLPFPKSRSAYFNEFSLGVVVEAGGLVVDLVAPVH